MVGPSGKIMLMPESTPNADIIMVATGTGIAPYRGFIRRLFVEDTPARAAFTGLAWLFLGVANSDALLYDEDWQKVKAEYVGQLQHTPTRHHSPPLTTTHHHSPPLAEPARYPNNFRVDYALSREQKNKEGGKMYIQDKVHF